MGGGGWRQRLQHEAKQSAQAQGLGATSLPVSTPSSLPRVPVNVTSKCDLGLGLDLSFRCWVLQDHRTRLNPCSRGHGCSGSRAMVGEWSGRRTALNPPEPHTQVCTGKPLLWVPETEHMPVPSRLNSIHTKDFGESLWQINGTQT